MGNYRFRLSDMIPNAWFYKLKDMGKTRNHNTTIHPTKKKQPPTSSATATQPSKPKQPHLSHQRKSYYFTRDLTPQPPPPPPPPTTTTDSTTFYNINSPTTPKASDTHFKDPPRKSSNIKRRSTRRNRTSPRPRLNVTSTVSAGCSCRATLESVWTKPDSTSEDYPNSPPDSSSDHEFGSDRGLAADSFDGMVSWSTSCHCNMDDKSFNRKFDGFDTVGEVELPPIITKKPVKFNDAINDIKKKKKETNESTTLGRTEDTMISTLKEQRTNIIPVRRFSVNSPGLKLRTNSPRIASRKIQAHGRKTSSSRRSLSENFAVVKSSSDPQRDFRESMVEMILENNIRASKDLEELLACYLSLNSDEYHDVIIKVFKQIWFDLTDTPT